jgi:hypothetical protein
MRFGEDFKPDATFFKSVFICVHLCLNYHQRMDNNPDDKRTLRVASVQFESAPGDKDANFRKIEAFVEQAARENVRLIVFPECCITGYWFIRNLLVEALAQMAEPIFDGPSSRV